MTGPVTGPVTGPARGAGELRIETLDPFDEPRLAGWHAAYAAAQEREVGEFTQTYTLPELRVQVQQPTSGRTLTSYVGLLGEEVVATGALGLPLRDNLRSAFVQVAVHPDHQARGYGRAMAEHVERCAAEAGRTLLDTDTRWRPEHGPDATEAGGSRPARFARARGYALVLGDVQRRLELPVAAGLLDRLSAEAVPHHAGYELRSWVGPVPDDLAEGWVALDADLLVEAPTGDREVEAAQADVALLREEDASLAGQGRTQFHTVALAPDGHVAAYTMLVHGVHDARQAFQWGTLVGRADRGQRLGLALKVANLRLLAEHRPALTAVSTWNAEVNAPMVAVNERLGFRAVARLGEWQKRLDAG